MHNDRSKGPRWWIFLPALIIPAFMLNCSEASAANSLEKAIERLQPCQSAKVETRLGTIGIDKFDKIAVEEIEINVKGDTASASTLASLTCRTSDQALLKGNAS